MPTLATDRCRLPAGRQDSANSLPASPEGHAAKIIALIPAHNEADCIVTTLRSLRGQVPTPDEIIVVADNCTDDTVRLAREAGALVFETDGNTDKKAGALNQALDDVLPGLRPSDYVLVLDADTIMVPGFLATALAAATRDPLVGAVGGIFHGGVSTSLLEQAQCNEYARYAREIDRVQRVMVLTGTASLIRVEALRDIAAHRGTTLPGTPGDVYDRTALTEDMELTLALKARKWFLLSPSACQTVTQLMPDRGALHRQRVRWYRGALDNLKIYGMTDVTRRYWFQQVMLALGAFAMSLYVAVTIADIVMGDIHVNLFWIAVGALFVLERVVTAWQAGKRGRWLALFLFPEVAYDLHLQWAFVRAVVAHMRGEQTAWHHLTPKES